MALLYARRAYWVNRNGKGQQGPYSGRTGLGYLLEPSSSSFCARFIWNRTTKIVAKAMVLRKAIVSNTDPGYQPQPPPAIQAIGYAGEPGRSTQPLLFPRDDDRVVVQKLVVEAWVVLPPIEADDAHDADVGGIGALVEAAGQLQRLPDGGAASW